MSRLEIDEVLGVSPLVQRAFHWRIREDVRAQGRRHTSISAWDKSPIRAAIGPVLLPTPQTFNILESCLDAIRGRKRPLRPVKIVSLLDSVTTEKTYPDVHQAVKLLIDHLGSAVAIFDSVGRFVHQTPALTAMLSAEPNICSVMDEATDIARSLCAATALSKDDRSAMEPFAPHIQHMWFGAIRYQLKAVHADRALSGRYFGGLGVLVVIERDPPLYPLSKLVLERFGLTQAQGNVALLLIEGLSHHAISVRLGISRHTVSRHLEALFSKLNVHSRVEAIAVLRGNSHKSLSFIKL